MYLYLQMCHYCCKCDVLIKIKHVMYINNLYGFLYFLFIGLHWLTNIKVVY